MIKYKEYLLSTHWRQFRKQILSIRNKCQNCGGRNNLNLHHKHYKSIGKEKNEDIIVLCKICHNNFHKKKKWIKKYRQNKVLDFTGTENKDSVFYNSSNILRLCRRCGESHSIFYKIFRNGAKMLAMACPNSKPRTTYLKFEKNLDIPILGNKQQNRHWGNGLV